MPARGQTWKQAGLSKESGQGCCVDAFPLSCLHPGVVDYIIPSICLSLLSLTLCDLNSSGVKRRGEIRTMILVTSGEVGQGGSKQGNVLPEFTRHLLWVGRDSLCCPHSRTQASSSCHLGHCPSLGRGEERRWETRCWCPHSVVLKQTPGPQLPARGREA